MGTALSSADLYIATCPPRHRYDNVCVPPKDSECIWFAVHPRLTRPPTVSDCMPRATERPSALDRPHTSHERTRRGRANAVRLTPNSLLPCREVILHNATHKSLLNGILYGYHLQYNIQLVHKLDCIVTHLRQTAHCAVTCCMLRRT